MRLIELNVAPCPAPRQTRRDQFAPSDAVLRYRAFRDHLAYAWNLTHVEFPEAGAIVTFWLPMPQSWSKKRKREMAGQPHRQKPDADNLFKAFADSLYRDRDDSFIYDVHISKYWHDGLGRIQVEIPA